MVYENTWIYDISLSVGTEDIRLIDKMRFFVELGSQK